MTDCPRCKHELQELDLDIDGETEEIQSLMNAREYKCPNCGAKIIVNIKVDSVELNEDDEEEEDGEEF